MRIFILYENESAKKLVHFCTQNPPEVGIILHLQKNILHVLIYLPSVEKFWQTNCAESRL